MNCDRFSEVLNDYIDGALDEVQEARAAEHVAACPDCAADVRALRRTRDLTKQYGAELAPEGFEAAVRARIESELRARRQSGRQGGARVFKFGKLPKWAALAATFAIVVLAGMHFNVFHFSPSGGIKSSKMVMPDKISSDTTITEKRTSEKPPAEPREGAAISAGGAADQAKDKNMVVSAKGAGTALNGDMGGGSAALSESVAPSAPARKRYDAESVAPTTDEAAAAENAIEKFDMQHALASKYEVSKNAPESEAKPASVSGREAAALSKSEAPKPEQAEKKNETHLLFAAPAASETAGVRLTGYNVGSVAYDYFAPTAMPSVSFEGVASAAPETSAAPGGAMTANVAGIGGGETARATDVINAPDPAAAVQKCLKIIKDFASANPGSGAQWQISGNHLFISGPYKIMIRMREKLAAGFGGVKPAPAAAAAKPAEKAKAARTAPAFAPDMPAVLTVYINKIETAPASAPADAATPAKEGGK